MPAAPLPPPAPAPAFVEASKPPTTGDDLEAGKQLPLSSPSSAAPPPAVVPGAALAAPAGGPGGCCAARSSRPSLCARLSPALIGWLLFAIGALVSLIWVVGLPVANLAPGTCAERSNRLLASPNPLAQLVAYERLRALVTCKITTNVWLTAGGALCLVPWLLGSLVPCCCTRKGHCPSLAEAKGRRSRAAGVNTAASVLGVAALIGLVAMLGAEVREGRKMDTPEARAQMEELARAARAGQQAATAVDGIIESVTQAIGLPPAALGVGPAASGDGLLGRLFKP
jgi:hypothetical protein